jgi:hypothetical protein
LNTQNRNQSLDGKKNRDLIQQQNTVEESKLEQMATADRTRSELVTEADAGETRAEQKRCFRNSKLQSVRARSW